MLCAAAGWCDHKYRAGTGQGLRGRSIKCHSMGHGWIPLRFWYGRPGFLCVLGPVATSLVGTGSQRHIDVCTLFVVFQIYMDYFKYDESLVGRRCTAHVTPDEGETWEAGYFPATIVAFNGRAAAHKGRFLLHFDDGLRVRIDLPEETVRILTARVDS